MQDEMKIIGDHIEQLTRTGQSEINFGKPKTLVALLKRHYKLDVEFIKSTSDVAEHLYLFTVLDKRKERQEILSSIAKKINADSFVGSIMTNDPVSVQRDLKRMYNLEVEYVQEYWPESENEENFRQPIENSFTFKKKGFTLPEVMEIEY